MTFVVGVCVCVCVCPSVKNTTCTLRAPRALTVLVTEVGFAYAAFGRSPLLPAALHSTQPVR